MLSKLYIRRAKVRQGSALCLLLLFAMYYISIASCTHSHYIDGRVITHSHPYKGEHSHTSSQLLTIALLSVFQTEVPQVYQHTPVVYRPLLPEPTVANENFTALHLKGFILLRAPPTCA